VVEVAGLTRSEHASVSDEVDELTGALPATGPARPSTSTSSTSPSSTSPSSTTPPGA
jgi:hypothetical protein